MICKTYCDQCGVQNPSDIHTCVNKIPPKVIDWQSQQNEGSITQVFTGLPLRKLRALLDEGWALNGLSIERKGVDGNVRRGAITLGGMVLWWHEAEGAAPAPLPMAHLITPSASSQKGST